MALMIGCVIAALAFAIAMAIGAEKIRAAQGCRHRWTTIPQRTVDFMAGHGIGLPDAYVGSTVAPWCVKCRAKKGEIRTIHAADGHIVRIRGPVKRDPLRDGRSGIRDDRFTRHGHRFGDRHGALLITCPLCGAWVGSHDGLRWVCDDGHVIWPTFGATA